MKYWDFNVTNLIADFNKNQRTLAGVVEGLEYTRRLLQDPLTEKSEGEVKAYIRMLEMREAEYRWYTDMVILGRDIAKQIENELTYPGQIKVNVIRESKVTEYAK